MVATQVSEKSRLVLESQIAKWKKDEERLAQLEAADQKDYPGGKMLLGKRWDATKGEKGEYVPAKFADILIFQIDPVTHQPIESSKTWKDKAGIEHPQYAISHSLRLPEESAFKVFNGDAKACTLWLNKPKRRY